MVDTLRDPWSEAWDIRDSMIRLREDATIRGLVNYDQSLLSVAVMYGNSALRLGNDVLVMVEQDTAQRMQGL